MKNYKIEIIIAKVFLKVASDFLYLGSSLPMLFGKLLGKSSKTNHSSVLI